MDNETSVSLQLGAFGKLPAQGDFIRLGAALDASEAFFRWIEHGMVAMRYELSGRWSDAFQQLQHGFVFRPDTGSQTLCGVLQASHDAAGRPFPLTLFLALPSEVLDEDLDLIPALADSLLPVLQQRLATCHTIPGLAALEAHLLEPLKHTISPEAQLSRFDHFIHDYECRDLVTAPELAPRLLDAVLIALSQSNGSAHASSPLCIPLKPSPAARTLELQFWLELCTLGAQTYPPTWSLFWPTGASPLDAPSLVLSGRQPNPALFSQLLRPSELHRLQASPAAHPGQSLPHLPWVTADMPLISVLQKLWTGYPDTCPWPR